MRCVLSIRFLCALWRFEIVSFRDYQSIKDSNARPSRAFFSEPPSSVAWECLPASWIGKERCRGTALHSWFRGSCGAVLLQDCRGHKVNRSLINTRSRQTQFRSSCPVMETGRITASNKLPHVLLELRNFSGCLYHKN